MKTLIIKTLQSKVAKTKNGDKDKWVVSFVEKPDQLFDSWKTGWNGGWGVGTSVNIEDDQWESRDWEGKKYWSIKAPMSARFNGVTRQEFNQALKDVHRLIEGLQAQISAIDGVDDPKLWPVDTTNTETPAVDPNELAQMAEITPEEIPF